MVLAAPLPHHGGHAPRTSGAPLRVPPAVVRRYPAPKVPLPLKIARTAQSRIGVSNRRYLRSAPRRACAAFVSAVLQQLGALPKRAASASAPVLAQHLAKAGWQKYGPMTLARASTFSRPGDALFLHNCRGGRIRHVTLAGVTRGTMIGTSSSRLHVMRYWIAHWAPRSDCVRLFRHAERR